jgi:hypothetical protein
MKLRIHAYAFTIRLTHQELNKLMENNELNEIFHLPSLPNFKVTINLHPMDYFNSQKLSDGLLLRIPESAIRLLLNDNNKIGLKADYHTDGINRILFFLEKDVHDGKSAKQKTPDHAYLVLPIIFEDDLTEE